MRKLLSPIFIFLLVKLSAQTVTTPEINKQLVPPSPEAAALGKYGILPVTLYSGQANVSVPLVELKSAKLSIPISLSYNNNGYRPGEEASWVGLGWSLQGMGVITRIVKGKVDESDAYSDHWQDYADVLDVAQNQDYLTLAGQGDADTEPDIYIFNFSGHSGKFVLIGNRAFLFPHQDLKISLESNDFKIVDDNGIAYWFQDKDTTNARNKTGGSPFMPAYTSAWNLTKIVSADGLDEIDFTYTTWTHSQANLSYSETYQAKVGITASHHGCSGLSNGCDLWTTSTLPGASLSVKRLTKITGKDSYISFVPEATKRKDMSSTSAYALKEIDVYGKPDSLLRKKISFVHNYFGDTTNSLNCQLKLTGVDLAGYYVNKTIGNSTSSDSIVLPGYYSFQYNNDGGSFPKGSRAIDKYGYYNGKNNSSLFDADFLGYMPIMTPGDRSVDISYSINGVLSRITYPTGGYTTFDYEVNRIGGSSEIHQQEVNSQASKTTFYDGNGDTTVTGQSFTINELQIINILLGRDFGTYDSSTGVVNNHRILHIYLSHSDTGMAELVYTSKKLGKAISSATDTLTLTALGTYIMMVTCESTSTKSFATVFYKTIITTTNPNGDPGPGLRIKNIYSYDNINSSSPAITKSYKYEGGVALSLTGYGYSSTQHQNEWGMYTEYIYTSDYSSPLFTLVNDQFYYPKVTEINHDTAATGRTVYEYGADGVDALGVFLIAQSDYAVSGGSYVFLKQKINTYDSREIINLWGFTTSMSQIVDDPSCNCNILIPDLQSPDIYDTISRFKLYEPHEYYLSSELSFIKSTDEISYDQAGANPMIIHTDYYYDNPNHLQPTRLVTLNSKGDTVITQTKYPLDYSVASCGSLYSIDTAFVNARDNVSLTFRTCLTNRRNAVASYYNSSVRSYNNSALKAAIHNYTPQCESVCKSSYGSAISTMIGAISSYYSCLNTAGTSGSGLTDAQKAIALMQAYHHLTTPVEQIVSIKKGSTEYLFGATKTDFSVNGSYGIAPKTAYETGYSSTSTLKSSFVSSPSSYYKAKVNFSYDLFDNVAEQSKTNDVKMSYIWDYNYMYPIAQAVGPTAANIAYTSFETANGGNWNIGSESRVSGGITGSKSYSLSNGSITIGSLSSAITYTVSYWLYSGSVSVSNSSSAVSKITKNGWTCYETAVTGYTSYTISGTGNIDELRLFPQGSQMTTYTYDPLVGLTSSVNPNYLLSYYDYDPLGRVRGIRDADRNILKKFDYKYQVSYTTYLNTQQSGSYTRNNCSSGQTGSSVTYTVPAGIYSSQISQADANQKATDDVNANGQAYANANGTCTSGVNLTSTNWVGVSGFTAVFTNTSTSQQYSFNVSSSTSQYVALGTLPAATYNITISKSGNSTHYVFTFGNYSVNAASASFSNVAISTSANNYLNIDSD